MIVIVTVCLQFDVTKVVEEEKVRIFLKSLLGSAKRRFGTKLSMLRLVHHIISKVS